MVFFKVFGLKNTAFKVSTLTAVFFLAGETFLSNRTAISYTVSNTVLSQHRKKRSAR